jgi:hypothetical protein
MPESNERINGVTGLLFALTKTPVIIWVKN